MKKWKTSRNRIMVAKESTKIFTYLALQEKILPKWRKVALQILSDEEEILINNSNCL